MWATVRTATILLCQDYVLKLERRLSVGIHMEIRASDSKKVKDGSFQRSLLSKHATTA